MATNFAFETTVLFIALFSISYFLYLVIWRLYFSPLAKYPGPKPAAATRWYEFYYDVVKRNRFSWEIQRMHDAYGQCYRVRGYQAIP